jgi:hypothetical protein
MNVLQSLNFQPCTVYRSPFTLSIFCLSLQSFEQAYATLFVLQYSKLSHGKRIYSEPLIFVSLPALHHCTHLIYDYTLSTIYAKTKEQPAKLLSVLGISCDQKINVTLRRVITFFKVIIALTLKEFCFRVKAIHLQDTTKSPITENKFW